MFATGFGSRSVTLRTDDAVVGRKALFIDFTGVDRSSQGAVGFAVVAAVTEAALAEIGAKFTKGVFDFLAIEMAEAEFLQAG